MPIKQAASKALRQSRKRTERNQRRKRGVKQQIRKSLEAITKQEVNAATVVRAACQAIDKAVQKGTLHANTGARRKSKLMKRLNALNSPQNKSI